MYYGPHTLEIRKDIEIRDVYNRTIEMITTWERVGVCRCDDNTTSLVDNETGKAYIPTWHIVANRQGVKAGDYVRVLNGEEVRAEGEVKKVIKTNYLDYMSLYV